MLPSAQTTAKTALLDPSGDAPKNAVPTAPVESAPGIICVGIRGVRLPAYTPPSVRLGAPSSGSPGGSRMVDEPSPSNPYGAFTGQILPKALLIEIPNGLLTPVKFAVVAAGSCIEFRKAKL